MPKVDTKELQLKALRQAGVGYPERLTRWQYVAEIFQIPSPLAIKLCEYYGVNPNQRVGGCEVCDESAFMDADYNFICECED